MFGMRRGSPVTEPVTDTRSLRALFGTAVAAGLIASAAAAAFHLVVTERLMDRAIEHETQTRRVQEKAVVSPVVSRTTQKVGLVVGLLVYGAASGLLLAVGYTLVEGWLTPLTLRGRGWVVAACGGWSVSLFPFLKYPANPPGVGDPQTIAYRQALYLTFIALSLVGVALAGGMAARLASRRVALGQRRSSWPLVAGLYAPYAAALYLAMPANPDAIRMPSDVVWGFRLASLTGLALFWGVLGGAFGWLAQGRIHG